MSTQMQGFHKVSSPGAASPDLGQNYAALVAANPYRNQEYKKSPWQNFLTSLGFRTQADAWQENMNVQAAEYDAALAQKAYNEQFESPSAEAGRMRQAGLNPDLQGIGDVAGASPMGDDPSTPMQSTGDEAMLGQVASFTLNAFTQALGIVQGLQGMHSTFLDNSMKKIQIDKGISEYAQLMWPFMLPDSPDLSAGDGLDLMANNFDWQSAALKNANAFAGHINPKYRKRFVSEMERYWSSAPGQAESYMDFKKRVQERRNFYTERGTFYSDIDDVLQEMVDPLVKGLERLTLQRQSTEQHELQASQNESEYQEKLYGDNGLDPLAEAGSRNATNALVDTNASMTNTLNETIEKIISNLQHTANNENGLKGALANVALVLMASVRLYLANMGIPSISSSRSFGTSNYGADSYNKSSFNLNF